MNSNYESEDVMELKTVKMSSKKAAELLQKYTKARYRLEFPNAKNGLRIPIVPDIDSTILKAIEKENLKHFDMGMWHNRCHTTHCRAGWAIHLAGEAGYELERLTSSSVAGKLIYALSSPSKSVPDFYTDKETALKSIRRNAAYEQRRKNAKKRLKTIKE